jgi:hypothetical protein
VKVIGHGGPDPFSTAPRGTAMVLQAATIG